MAILVSCGCGRQFQTADGNAGRRAKCPECGRELIIPKPQPGELEEFAPSIEAEGGIVSGKSIASLVLGLLSLVTCVFTGIPAIVLGCLGISDVNRSKGRISGGWMAVTGIVLGILGCSFVPIALLLPAVQSAREAARRAQCVSNLKQIGLAMHNFHDQNGMLPPAAITDANGKPLLSWRVAILPYIEGQALYEKFHLDEPWDSPNNRALLTQMPSLYACPSDQLPPGQTSYQVVVGPTTLFTGNRKGVRLSDVTDGTSNTMMVVEAARLVDWTAPDEVSLNQVSVGALPFGSRHPFGFNALFADGSVRFLQSSINGTVLGALLTRAGGEVVTAP